MKSALWRDGLDDAKRATYEALHAALVKLAHVSAPLLPFLAEAVHEALGGERSVHLADWPAPGERDDRLVSQMRQLRTVVRLARRVREEAGVKHRQPLRAAAIAGVDLEHRELLASELNVKRVDELVDPDAVVERELVLDYAQLGKRLRGKVKAVAAAVRAGAYTIDGERVRVLDEVLEPHEVTWRVTARPGAAARDGFVVVLDLAVDDVLAREGLARELNRAVQDLRKRARLPYAARVRLAVVSQAPVIDACLKDHGAWLCEQASAELVRHSLASDHTTTLDIDDMPVTLELALVTSSSRRFEERTDGGGTDAQ
jgi:isoleucyl-tRNA synthetase